MSHFFGPVFFYDLVRTARRSRYFLARAAYLGVLAFILAWLYFLWTMRFQDQVIPNQAMITFAETFFYFFLCVQFLVVLLITPAYTAGAIAEEKEHRTMEFMLATDLRNREIVLGKFAARLGNLLLLIAAGLPILSLIQLIGGIDPDLLLGSFEITLLTVVSLATLSILFSVYQRRARDAILLAYFAAFIYWTTSAMLLSLRDYPDFIACELVGGSEPYTVEDLLWHMNAGNPFVLCVRLSQELASGKPLLNVLPGLLRNYAFFYIPLILISFIWAVLRLRTVALQQAEGKPRRSDRKLAHWGRPRVGNDPMLWKEIFEPGMHFGTLGRAVTLTVMGLLVVPASAVFIDSLQPGGASFWGEHADHWIRALFSAALTFMLVAVGIRAAGSLSGERDQLTLDGLLTTPLSSNAILFAKWLGAIAGARWAWFLLAAIWGLGVYGGRLEWWVFPLLVFLWCIYAGFIAQMGLWFSLVSPTTLRATLRTLLAAIGLSLGHWLMWFYYLPLYLHLDAQMLDFSKLKDLHIGLTPPAVMALLAFVPEWSETKLLTAHYLQPAAFAGAGAGLTVCATFFLFLATRARFRVLCARTPYLQPERQIGDEKLAEEFPPTIRRFAPFVRRRTIVIASLSVAPIVLLVGSYRLAYWLSERRLQNLIAEIEAGDPHWRFWDIEAHRKEYPDEENGALEALAARAKLPAGWMSPPLAPGGTALVGFGPRGDVSLDEYLFDTPPEQQLDPWQLQDLRLVLSRAKRVSEECRALVKYTGGRIPVAWTPNIWSTMLPGMQNMRDVATLLRLDSLLRAQENDIEGAMLSARAIIHVGRCIGDEQMLISQLVRMAIENVGLRAMERVLAQGQPSEEALRAFQELLEEEVQQPLFVYGLRGERAGFQVIMEFAQRGELDPGLVGGSSAGGFFLSLTSRSSQLFGLKYYQQVLEIARQPLHEQRGLMKPLENKLRAWDAPPLARMLLPATQKVGEAFQRTQAGFRAAVLTLAAERYSREHGRWPDTPAALVPKYLKEVPLDPYTGHPLLLRRLDDGLVLYSVGIDRADNGGKLDINPHKQDCDWGFRLWDPGARRQAPRNPDRGPPFTPGEKQP